MRQAGRAASVVRHVMRGAGLLRRNIGLLASVYAARFIVWRTLRRRRREHAARRRQFQHVASDSGPDR
jgi:hypothetical protein